MTDVYPVEKIIGKRTRCGKKEYKVKWEGYPSVNAPGSQLKIYKMFLIWSKSITTPIQPPLRSIRLLS